MHKYTGPHDYFNDDYVEEWVSVANSKRPFRHAFFTAFASEPKSWIIHEYWILGVGRAFWPLEC